MRCLCRQRARKWCVTKSRVKDAAAYSHHGAALYSLNSSQQDTCFYKADEILAEYCKITEKNAKNNTEIMAGVLSVFSKMDSLL